jgi:hypothetical protein
MWLNGGAFNARTVNGVPRLLLNDGGAAVIDGLAAAFAGLTRTGGGSAAFPLLAEMTPLALRTLVGTAATTAGVTLAGSRVMAVGGTATALLRANFFQENDRYLDGTAVVSLAAEMNVSMTFFGGAAVVATGADLAGARGLWGEGAFAASWGAALEASAVRHIAGQDVALVDLQTQFEPSWSHEGLNYVGGFGTQDVVWTLADDAFRVQPFVGSFDVWGGATLGPVLAVRQVAAELVPINLALAFAPHRLVNLQGQVGVVMAMQPQLEVYVQFQAEARVTLGAAATTQVVCHVQGEVPVGVVATGQLQVTRCATGDAGMALAANLVPVRLVKYAGQATSTVQADLTDTGLLEAGGVAVVTYTKTLELTSTRALQGWGTVAMGCAASFCRVVSAAGVATVTVPPALALSEEVGLDGLATLALGVTAAPSCERGFAVAAVVQGLAALSPLPYSYFSGDTGVAWTSTVAESVCRVGVGVASVVALGAVGDLEAGVRVRGLEGTATLSYQGALLPVRVRALVGAAPLTIYGENGYDLVTTLDQGEAIFIRPASQRVFTRPFLQRDFLRAA